MSVNQLNKDDVKRLSGLLDRALSIAISCSLRMKIDIAERLQKAAFECNCDQEFDKANKVLEILGKQRW